MIDGQASSTASGPSSPRGRLIKIPIFEVEFKKAVDLPHLKRLQEKHPLIFSLPLGEGGSADCAEKDEAFPIQKWLTSSTASGPPSPRGRLINPRFPLCFNSTGETLKPGRKRVRHTVIFAVLRVHAGGIDGHIVLTRCGLYRTARYGNRR